MPGPGSEKPHSALARSRSVRDDTNVRQALFAAAGPAAGVEVAIAVGELDRDLLEERLGAELNGDVGSSKHVCPIN